MSSTALTVGGEGGASGPIVQGMLGDEDEAHARRAAVLGEARSILAHLPEDKISKPKHTLEFLKNIAYKHVGGQQLSGDCMFCMQRITSTGASKVVIHFTTCALCPGMIRDACIMLQGGTHAKRKLKVEHEAIVRVESEAQLHATKVQKHQLRQQGIKAGFQTAEVSVADEAIAKFFYANALSFGAADTSTDSYYREMVRAIQQAPSSYVPPNKRKIATRLLQSTYDATCKDIKNRDPYGLIARKYGRAYCSDGWDSCDNLPLINSAAITANDGGQYLRSVDTSGRTKSAEYCAALMIEDIYEHGCTSFVITITDTCAVMKKSWKIVEDEFPWITAAPCQTHCPSLLVGDIAKLAEPAQTIRDETLLVAWFSNHHKPLAILRKKVLQAFGKPLELRKAGATRMGTNTWVGERLEELKSPMQQTVVDSVYVAEQYKDLPLDFDIHNGERIAREHRGGTAKKLALDDEIGGFWFRVRRHLTVCNHLHLRARARAKALYHIFTF